MPMLGQEAALERNAGLCVLMETGRPLKFCFYTYLFGVHVCVLLWRSEDDSHGSVLFSPMWGTGTELRLSGLVACALSTKSFSWPGRAFFLFYNKLICRLFVGYYLHKGNTNLSLPKNVSAVIYEHI